MSMAEFAALWLQTLQTAPGFHFIRARFRLVQAVAVGVESCRHTLTHVHKQEHTARSQLVAGQQGNPHHEHLMMSAHHCVL